MSVFRTSKVEAIYNFVCKLSACVTVGEQASHIFVVSHRLTKDTGSASACSCRISTSVQVLVSDFFNYYNITQ